MNERMAELFGQAGISDSINEEFGIEYLVKLILLDCFDVINADIEYQIKAGIISNVHGLNQARELIKQHFGIEE